MNKVPNFFKEILIKDYGENLANKIVESYLKKKYTTLRVNTLRANATEVKSVLTQEKINFKEVSWYKDALIIENTPKSKIENLKLYEYGEIYLQNLSSMIPAIILAPKPNENILDMAAAPRWKNDANCGFV